MIDTPIKPVLMHFEMTFEEHKAARGGRYLDPERQPEMICHTGDGHAVGTRNKASVTCPACLAALAQTSGPVQAFAARIIALGFRVWVAQGGEGRYGFISDAAGARVLSFSFNDGGSLGGNYGPPSKTSGTGWRMDCGPEILQTAHAVRTALHELPPSWCGNGWTYLTTVEQHLAAYGSSSGFVEQ